MRPAAFPDAVPLLGNLLGETHPPSGAEVQPGVGDGKRLVSIHDGVLAAAVGIETSGGVFTPLISAGTATPCKSTEVFSTAEDNQESLSIAVYLGEAQLVAEATLVGRFTISAIRKERAGKPQIEVMFQIAADGRFSLSAKDASSEQPLRVDFS